MNFFTRQGRALLLAATLFLLVCGGVAFAQPTISAVQLKKEYSENQMKFDNNYKGKRFYVTGTIKNIDKDILDRYYIALETGEWSVITINIYNVSPNLLAELKKGQSVRVLVEGVENTDVRAVLSKIEDPTTSASPNQQSGRGASTTPQPAKSSTDGCSFAELKTPPLVTFSSTDEDSKSWDEGWYDINLYVNPQTKDSILTMESYGGKGKEAYKFVFNKNLTDAEVTLCCFGSVESSLCGKKKTLKTSKDAEKELRETFQTARKELSMKLSGSGGGNATEYVKSGTKYLDRGDKNNNKADYDLAIAEFDRAIKLDPNIAEAYFGRGRGYLRKGDNSRAVADYSQAIRLNPNDIISYSNRGRAYARMGDYDNAVADFESALRIDPNNTAIKQNLEKARKKEKGL